jgi:hypothetical protein
VAVGCAALAGLASIAVVMDALMAKATISPVSAGNRHRRADAGVSE